MKFFYRWITAPVCYGQSLENYKPPVMLQSTKRMPRATRSRSRGRTEAKPTSEAKLTPKSPKVRYHEILARLLASLFNGRPYHFKLQLELELYVQKRKNPPKKCKKKELLEMPSQPPRPSSLPSHPRYVITRF